MSDYYQTLGVQRTATPEEIKKNANRIAESRKSKQSSTIDNSYLEDEFAFFTT